MKIQKSENDCIYLPGDPWLGTNIIKHRIITTTDKPIVAKPYNCPYKLRDEVDKQVQNWLDLGIIRESDSDFGSPLWIVPKKPDSKGNPQWRCVIDYQKLNKYTLMSEYPLPTITSIFDRIGGAKYFTTLDLASGFLQIPVHEADIHKTAFSTHKGHFEFLKMPFGLKTAPKTFQKAMDICLRGLIGYNVFCYMDDVVIFANSVEEHKRVFNEVMERFRKYNFKIQIDKCKFLASSVSYLGHILGETGIKPDPKKVEAVRNFPVPKNRKNIRQFMGLSGFYRRFIKNYAQIGKPLFKLLQDGEKFIWGKDQQSAFEKLKLALCSAPILIYPDFKKDFLIFTDASGVAVGAVLAQGTALKNNPIAYYSRIFRKNELKFSTIERECLAISEAIKAFKQYVYASHFTIFTDHKPLTTQKECLNNERCQRWRLALQGYDYDIKYFPGKSNLCADALSRGVNFIFNIYMFFSIFTSVLFDHCETFVVDAVTRLQVRNRDKPVDQKIDQKNEEVEKHVKKSKKKRGRPKKKQSSDDCVKTNDKILFKKSRKEIESAKNAESAVVKNKKLRFVTVRDSIDIRHDNILYFLDSSGNCVDEGSKRLKSRNLLPKRKNFDEFNFLQRNKKFYFEICVNIECASDMIKGNVKKCLHKLRETMLNKKITSFSMSICDIGILKWLDLKCLLEEVFKKDDIPTYIFV